MREGSIGSIVLCFICLGLQVTSPAYVTAEGNDKKEMLVAKYESGRVVFGSMANAGIRLTVASPDGEVLTKSFGPREQASFSVESNHKFARSNGIYTYELQVIPVVPEEAREAMMEARESGDYSVLHALQEKGVIPRTSILCSGHFSIKEGLVVDLQQQEETVDKDVLHYDDVIITGSLCVGFDCQDGESFGFDTIILKEHNLRIYFNDTSYTASYPTNNWRITINDSTNGGASYFSIDDVDDGVSIFKIEAGAPSNSLYIEDYGRVGLGTSTPVVELHIKDSDTPTVRLEQDSSGGWTAQTWDVAGNESNFFVRDATSGSKLPFRIQPGTPSSTLCLKSDGRVGIGTWSPSSNLEVEAVGPAKLTLDNTQQKEWSFNSSADGTFRISDTDATPNVEMELDGSGNLIISGSLTTAGSSYPDYVFDPKYELMPLNELEEFISMNGHLPNVHSAEDVDQGRSINMTQLQLQLLEKLEELTLYTLSQENRLHDQDERIEQLTTENDDLRTRLASIEKYLENVR